MNTATDVAHNKALSDQLRVSVTQAIRQVYGTQPIIIKITDGNLTSDKLTPEGEHLTLRLSIDVYPDHRNE